MVIRTPQVQQSGPTYLCEKYIKVDSPSLDRVYRLKLMKIFSVEESKFPTLFEIGADVEIASSDDTTSRIWYPGNVVGLHLCDGVEKVAVECFTLRVQETVIADQIRPTPPPNGESKGFEMMDNVEVFYNKGWGSGQFYGDNSVQTWTDGVWKMAVEVQTCYFKGLPEKHNENPSQEDHVAEV
ncbi:hypothetical protein Rs2_41640 [Raphanus sativus]|nr:hypothetical protein Rs2_41640 [Raphanus sativus]